jgi:hypothetical protein
MVTNGTVMYFCFTYFLLNFGVNFETNSQLQKF